MSTIIDIDNEKKVEKPEEKPEEKPVSKKQKLAIRKQKNEEDNKKIAEIISYILKGLCSFTHLLKTFVKEDYMFKTYGDRCIDFIENLELYGNHTSFFLQNTETFNDFIIYIEGKVNNHKDETTILDIKKAFEDMKNTIDEKNKRKKLEQEEDEYDEDDEDDEEDEKITSPKITKRIRVNRQGSFVNFHEIPSTSSAPRTVANIVGQENQKITMKDITTILDEIYNSEESQQSTTLDILAIYLKGQKILYIEAKTHCEQHLNALMLPAIFISSLCTLLSVVLKDFNFGPILVSSLMAINSFILAMISYLKLDAKAEAHKITAYKFEKLQSLCELRSGRTLFMKNENGEKGLVEFINKLDEQVREIKESNQFILPEIVRYHYPILYSTNVFSDIKKIYNEEMIQRTRLKNLINKIKDDPDNIKTQSDRDRLLEQIIKCRDKYLQIDDVFNKEISKQIIASKDKISCCNWLKT